MPARKIKRDPVVVESHERCPGCGRYPYGGRSQFYLWRYPSISNELVCRARCARVAKHSTVGVQHGN